METEKEYYQSAYDKLFEYLVRKGYRKEFIRKIKLHRVLNLRCTVSDDSGSTIDSYLIVTPSAIQKIPSLSEGKEEMLPEGFDKTINRYTVAYDAGKLVIREQGNRIKTVRTFYDRVILPFDAAAGEQFFYRGHSDSAEHFMRPGIYRPMPGKTDLSVLKEHIFYKEAIRRCPEDFDRLHSAFEHLVKMQHYRVPTRLLDITSNPLVALYFACSGNPDADGEVYAFRIRKEEIKYFDSDAVSVVANLARRPAEFSMPSESADIGAFNRTEQIEYLLHEIRYEKPQFLDKIRPDDLEKVFCVLPKLNNPRIIRQSGAFFLFGIDGAKGRMARFSFPFRRFVISASGKKRILEDLAKLGIDESALFPELETVADYLRHDNL